MRNLRPNPHVSLALDGTDDGREPVIVEGVATLAAAHEHEADLDQDYRTCGAQLARMSWPEEEARAEYRQVIRIAITRFVAF